MAANMVQTKGVKREGMRPVSVVLKHEAVEFGINLSELYGSLANQFAPPTDCSRIKRPTRVVLWRGTQPPLLATVRPQKQGGLFVKPDESYGSRHLAEDIQGHLYPVDTFDILVSRWILDCHEKIRAYKTL